MPYPLAGNPVRRYPGGDYLLRICLWLLFLRNSLSEWAQPVRPSSPLLYFTAGLLLSINLHSQENLILNPGLEKWECGKPANWVIVSKTVDIFKSNIRIIPPGVSSEKIGWRNRFPVCGHEGLSYFGIARDEIIQCKLSHPLIAGKAYELSFWVYNPPIFSDNVSNKVSVKFSDEPTKKETNHHNIEDFEIVYKADSSEFKAPQWVNAKLTYIAKGNEQYLTIGFFKDLGLDLVYYLFDDFHLRDIDQSRKTHTLYFDRDQHKLTNDHLRNTKEFLHQFSQIDSILIQGFASEAGNNNYNEKLSSLRNESIQKWLIKHVKTDKIKSLAYGERFSEGKDPKKFRRVDVTCFYHALDLKPLIDHTCEFDSSLMNLLAEIEDSDQQIRINYDSVFRSNANDTLALRELEHEMEIIDAMNISKIETILKEYGYPGISLVSPDYMNTAFLVLQHSPLEIREKYFDLIINACQQGEMDKTFLPYMIDRNRLDKGQKQIYGTQLRYNQKKKIYELFPVENENNLNEIRKEFGLGSIEKYLESIN